MVGNDEMTGFMDGDKTAVKCLLPTQSFAVGVWMRGMGGEVDVRHAAFSYIRL